MLAGVIGDYDFELLGRYMSITEKTNAENNQDLIHAVETLRFVGGGPDVGVETLDDLFLIKDFNPFDFLSETRAERYDDYLAESYYPDIV